MSRIRKLFDHGQSIWLDNLRRDMIWTGDLHRLVVEDGVRGLTSNPSIFDKAISKSESYDPAVEKFAREGLSASEIFEEVAVTDIQWACDVLRGVFDESNGEDGYVSLEVSPHLAHDTDGTIQQAHHLWERVGRDNLMIKVPGTDAGLPAIEELLAGGLNVNVTLLFSVERYVEVAEAYIRGLQQFAERGGDVSQVASVASFFISRIDVKIDGWLDERIAAASGDEAKKLTALKGKVAIANGKQAYREYERLFSSDAWKKLQKKGARPQRVLWASTSTKDPSYKDTLYIEELIGPQTVNTVPDNTLDAFRDHGELKDSLKADMDEADAVMKGLADADISMKKATDELMVEGVDKFAQSFDQLMTTLQTARADVLQGSLNTLEVQLPGELQKATKERLQELADARFSRRLWQRDGTLFSDDPEVAEEASRYMGWLDAVSAMAQNIESFEELQDDLQEDGIEDFVVMGMGGSSLAPEVFSRTFAPSADGADVHVLDSTVPAQVMTLQKNLEESGNILFSVASKSGSTTEPMAFNAYFWEQMKDGQQFVAVTDPGSNLEQLALERDFRAIYSGDPEVGGRYSALTPFGLIPAAASGQNIMDLLRRAHLMVGSCEAAVPETQNPGVYLGAILGEAALAGRNKLTVFTSEELPSFGAWLEQLVAESTGKHGQGIVPVDGEAIGAPDVYGNDRIFVAFEVDGDELDHDALDALESAGHPVLRFTLQEPEDVVQEMFRWEVATATAGRVLGINPFDQPNVQESKDYTKKLLGEAKGGKLGAIDGETEIWSGEGITLFGDKSNAAALKGASSLKDVLQKHLGRVSEGDYVAFNAYVEMNEANEGVLSELRLAVRDDKKVATTVGFGPRFLHSTGQLHKGGANTGVFLQITSNDAEPLAVPGEDFSFSLLKEAQQAGDFLALSQRERRLLRVHLGDDVQGGLQKIKDALS